MSGLMEYKDGQEWNGTHYEQKGGREPDSILKYEVKDGKKHGKYYEWDYGRLTIEAHYKEGVLDGAYKEERGKEYHKEGLYSAGKFSGTVTKTSRDEYYGHNREDIRHVETYNNDKLEHQVSTMKLYDGKEMVIAERYTDGDCMERLYGGTQIKYQQKDGQKNGLYQEIDPKGWVRVKAEYKDGRLNGAYTEYNNDGTIASQKLYDNGKDVTPPQPEKEIVMNGERREYDENRFLKAVYEVKDGQKHGKYTEYSKDANIIVEANYNQGELDGIYKERYKECVYEKGVLRLEKTSASKRTFDEKGILTHNTDFNEDMEYKDGKKWEGEVHFSRSDRDGLIEKENYHIKNGVKDGKYSYWNDSGKEISAEYKDGVLHGPYKSTTRNTVQEGVYNEGNFTGIITETTFGQESFKHEKQTVVGKYENDRLVDSSCYVTDRNGNVLLSRFVKQTPVGMDRIEVRPDGSQIKYLQNCDKKEDIYQEVDSKGQVRLEAKYSNNKLDGFYTKYNSDGTIAEQKLYRDGEDITARYAKLKEFAAQNISEEKGVIKPKQSKVKKMLIGAKMKQLKER